MTVLVSRLLLAAALGAAIGVNRELQRKPAGLRTHALVSLGGALLMAIGLTLQVGNQFSVDAASRVLQGIIAGIGFLGGGVILHRDDSKGVHGLTTAAAIWVVAATGIAVGAGMWRTGIAASILTLIVLAGGEWVDQRLHRTESDPPGRSVSR